MRAYNKNDMPKTPQSVRKLEREQRGFTAVDFSVIALEKEDCRYLVETYHYSGKCPGLKYCFGLLEGANIVGAVAYSQPASYTLCKGVCGQEYKDYVIELSRLVITTKTNNAASFLVGGSLALLPDHVVVSYADCNDHIGHVGYVYQSTNWVYTGQGNAEPIWLDPRTNEVVSYTRRHIDDKAAAIGLAWTDLVKVKQVGKHRYVYFTGKKPFKREAKKQLRYKILPYPKGTTNRHDATVLITQDKNNVPTKAMPDEETPETEIA